MSSLAAPRSGALAGAAGAVVLLAALVLELRVATPDELRTTLSAAAAEGTLAAPLTVAQGVYAAGLMASAPSLHRLLPGRGGAAPVALVVGGVAGWVLLAFRCGRACAADGLATTEIVHIVAVAVGAAATIVAPVLVARRVRGYPGWSRYARYSLFTSAGILVGLVTWGMAAGTPLGGVVERGAVALGAGWFAVTAARLSPPSRTWRD